MTDIPAPGEQIDEPVAAARTRTRLLATGGTIGALLASSCCVAPLLLVTLGVSGAWIGTLTALAPYKPYFLVPTAALLGVAFWQVYFKPERTCTEETGCARPLLSRITKTVLWLAAGLSLLAATVDLWAPLFY